MSANKHKQSEIPAAVHQQAGALARELFRPLKRPSAGQEQDEISFMRKGPKPEKKGLRKP